MSLHRTQIYIEEEQIRQLKIEAEKKHLAVSELIRRAINHFLRTKTRKINWNSDPLTRTIGKVKLRVSNASEEHDLYLYGEEKEKIN